MLTTASSTSMISFNVSLPPVFTLVDRREDRRSTLGKLPPKSDDKKRKISESEDNGIMKSERVNPMFALQGKEKWGDFCDVCMDSKPMWDEKRQTCLRWNIRGFCF